MEVFVLTELAARGGRHFCKIEDKGRFGHFNYVVMTLVGKSLQDLRKERNPQCLSLACSLSVSIQCLEALEGMVLSTVLYIYIGRSALIHPLEN